MCAANFGDFCTVVGQDNTERELVRYVAIQTHHGLCFLKQNSETIF